MWVVNKDGYIGIESTSKTEAAEMLNEIMSLLWLRGLEAHAIREFELGEVTMNFPEVTIGSMSSSLVSLRTMPAFDKFGSNLLRSLDDVSLSRRNITEDEFKLVISVAENATSEPFYKNTLLFLLEANTHLFRVRISAVFCLSLACSRNLA